jgi:hypothetical protein
MLRRIQQDVIDALRPCSCPEEACERYLEFAVSHAHEYELFYTHAYELSHPSRSDHASPLREHRPTMQFMETKLAERLGGTAADHTRLSLALWTMAHGTAMLLISRSIPAAHVPELRSVFTAAVETLINNSSGFSAQN